jgi:hypothetical protein
MALAQGADVQEGEGLLTLEELHGGNLPCTPVNVTITSVASDVDIPLMILQKMHEAAILVGSMMSCDTLLRAVRGWDAQLHARRREARSRPRLTRVRAQGPAVISSIWLARLPLASHRHLRHVQSRQHAALRRVCSRPHADTHHPAAGAIRLDLFLHRGCRFRWSTLVAQRLEPYSTSTATPPIKRL